MTTICFFDDVDVSLLPQADYYAGYADGIFANIAAIHSRFPAAGILSIAVRASDVADALDVEPFDATTSQAVPWFKLALSRGVTKPCIYSSVSNINTIVDLFNKAGIPRTAYRLWSAHYGLGSHICGPTTCKATEFACDATQFTSTAEGKSLDESVALSTFFSPVIPPPAGNPTLSLGDTGNAVNELQGRLNVWHASPQLTVDGSFGPATLTAVRTFQQGHALTVDGVVGPATWGALLKAPPPTSFGAPADVKADTHRVLVTWKPPAAVDGKEPDGYHLVLMEGSRIFHQGTVPVCEASYWGLSEGVKYDLEITATGGPGTPTTARVSFTA